MKLIMIGALVAISVNSFAKVVEKYAGISKRGEVCELTVYKFSDGLSHYSVTFGNDHLGSVPNLNRTTTVKTSNILDLPFGKTESEESCGYDSVKGDAKISFRHIYDGDVSGSINQIDLNYKDSYYKELVYFSAKNASFLFGIIGPSCVSLKVKSLETCQNLRKVAARL